MKSTNELNKELGVQVMNEEVVSLEVEDDEELDLDLDFDLDSDELSDDEIDQQLSEAMEDDDAEIDDDVEEEEEEVNKDDDEATEVDLFDLSTFTPSVCNQPVKAFGEAGVLSIIHSKNGMRVTLSKELMEKLGNPVTVQIGLSDTQIVIAEYLGDGYTSYSFSKGDSKSSAKSGATKDDSASVAVSCTKKIIYRSELVKQLKERYQLDFSNRTSITFRDAVYTKVAGIPVACITVN